MSYNKLLSFFFCAFLIIGLTNCNSTRRTGQTTMLKSTSAGQLLVKASGYGNIKMVSVNNAIQNAFKNILLQGIPGSNQSTPMLGKNSEKTYKAHEKFLDNLIENGTDPFILEQKNSDYKFFSVNDPSSEVELLINLAALRSHLEQNGILREFGF